MGDRKCPICNSDKKTKIGDINLINFDNEQGIFDHQTISKCEKCGSVFHEGIDMSLLDAHYAQYTGGSDVQKMTEDELVLNNNMANFIESHLNISKDAYILDVGCGYGWVIELLSDRGYKNIVGMDTDEPLMKKLQEQGYNVEVGSVYSQNREDLNGKYDVVILKMVMEHLENPYSAVENVRKWMNTNGVLVIEVPDCSLYDETAFFPGYFQSVNMEHINNFSLLSMTNMMKDWRVV